MVEVSKIIACLGDKTKVQILQILGDRPLTVTEIYNRLKYKVKYRESIFKALEKLRKAMLVERKYSEKKKAFEYSANFKRIEINQKGELKLVK